MTTSSQIKVSVMPDSLCICRSGKRAFDCCFKDGKFYKPHQAVSPSGKITNVAQKDCIANEDMNCSAKLSKEHVISKNVLEKIEFGGELIASGLPWGNPEGQKISPNTLVTKSLCERHNNALSGVDSEAGRFLITIDSFDKNFLEQEPIMEFALFSGRDIENWLLKTAINFNESNTFAKDGSRLAVETPPKWISILYEREEWPAGWGLYISKGESSIEISRNFGFMPLTAQDGSEIKALVADIAGLRFFLLLGKPDHPEHWGMYRPSEVVFRDNRVQKAIFFSWPDGNVHSAMIYDRIGTSVSKPTN